MHRRQLLKSSLAGSAALLASRYSGIRMLKAQSATYELVVIQEPDISIVDGSTAFYGSFDSISNGGTIGGSLAVSDMKVSPVLWAIAGERTKLKSGEFGARVTAVAGTEIAGGYGYQTRLGYPEEGFRSSSGQVPRVWKGAEIAELSLPADAVGESGRIIAVNESGTALGTCNRMSELSGSGLPTHFVAVDGNASFLMSDTSQIFDPFSPAFINREGTVLGTAEEQVDWASGGSSGTFWVDQAALYKAGNVIYLERPSDYPAASDPEAVTLNPSIVGLSDSDLVVVNYASTVNGITDTRSFVYDATTPTELESGDTALPYVSTALVSPSGLIYGTGWSEDRRTIERIIWRDGTPEKMGEFANEVELTLSSLTGINDDGVICGNAFKNGAWYGVILQPM